MSGWAATSDEIDKVAAAFVKAAGQLTDIVKDRTADAGSYSYHYADLASATGLARPVLAEHGLIVTQTPMSEGRDVSVATTILHESGQWLSYPPLTIPGGNSAQQAGSALSYARRYSLMAILGLATEDDDGARASRPSPPPPPATISQPNIDRFTEKADEAGANPDEVAAIVSTATNGRTTVLSEVLATEVAPLRSAFTAWMERLTTAECEETS